MGLSAEFKALYHVADVCEGLSTKNARCTNTHGCLLETSGPGFERVTGGLGERVPSLPVSVSGHMQWVRTAAKMYSSLALTSIILVGHEPVDGGGRVKPSQLQTIAGAHPVYATASMIVRTS
jgi:hypothetical protein